MPLDTLQQHNIPCRIVRHAQAKRIIIAVDQSGVRLTLPRRESQKRALAFLKSKLDWVLQQQAKYTAQPSLLERVTSNKTLPYLGNEYPVNVQYIEGDCASFAFNEHCFTLELPQGYTEEAYNDCLLKLSENWYRNRARYVIAERAQVYARQMGVSYNRISIRSQKTRWGSCSSSGNLSFNWRLMLVPVATLDYIIIHELAHLTHLNHTRNFWNLVKQHCPNYKQHEQQLKHAQRQRWS